MLMLLNVAFLKITIWKNTCSWLRLHPGKEFQNWSFCLLNITNALWRDWTVCEMYPPFLWDETTAEWSFSPLRSRAASGATWGTKLDVSHIPCWQTWGWSMEISGKGLKVQLDLWKKLYHLVNSYFRTPEKSTRKIKLFTKWVMWRISNFFFPADRLGGRPKSSRSDPKDVEVVLAKNILSQRTKTQQWMVTEKTRVSCISSISEKRLFDSSNFTLNHTTASYISLCWGAKSAINSPPLSISNVNCSATIYAIPFLKQSLQNISHFYF